MHTGYGKFFQEPIQMSEKHIIEHSMTKENQRAIRTQESQRPIIKNVSFREQTTLFPAIQQHYFSTNRNTSSMSQKTNMSDQNNLNHQLVSQSVTSLKANNSIIPQQGINSHQKQGNLHFNNFLQPKMPELKTPARLEPIQMSEKHIIEHSMTKENQRAIRTQESQRPIIKNVSFREQTTLFPAIQQHYFSTNRNTSSMSQKTNMSDQNNLNHQLVSQSVTSLKANNSIMPQQGINSHQKQRNLHQNNFLLPKMLELNPPAGQSFAKQQGEEENKKEIIKYKRNASNSSNNRLISSREQQKGNINQNKQEQDKKTLGQRNNNNIRYNNKVRKINQSQNNGKNNKKETQSEQQIGEEVICLEDSYQNEIDEEIDQEEQGSYLTQENLDDSQEEEEKLEEKSLKNDNEGIVILEDFSHLNQYQNEQNDSDDNEDKIQEKENGNYAESTTLSVQPEQSKKEISSKIKRTLRRNEQSKQSQNGQLSQTSKQHQNQAQVDVTSTVFCDICNKEFLEYQYLNHCKSVDFQDNPEKENNSHFISYIQKLQQQNQQLKESNQKLQEQYQKLQEEQILVGKYLREQKNEKQQQNGSQSLSISQQGGQQRLAQCQQGQKQLAQFRIKQYSYGQQKSGLQKYGQYKPIQQQPQQQVKTQQLYQPPQYQQRQKIRHRLHQLQLQVREQKQSELQQRRIGREQKEQIHQEELMEKQELLLEIQKKREEQRKNEQNRTLYFRQQRGLQDQQRIKQKQQEYDRRYEELQQIQDQRYRWQTQQDLFKRREIRWQQEQRWQQDQRWLKQKQEQEYQQQLRVRSQTVVSFYPQRQQASQLEEDKMELNKTSSGFFNNIQVSKDNKNICNICFDNIERGELAKMRCSHQFHQFCMSEWTQFKRECPLCNKRI